MKPNSHKYKQLHRELMLYKPVMMQAAETIRDQGVSDYPIMLIHQQEVSVGIAIAERGKVAGNWNVNASTLEEFLTKNLIEENKIDSFKTIYKSRRGFICLFVLSELGAEFIFLPEKNEEVSAKDS